MCKEVDLEFVFCSQKTKEIDLVKVRIHGRTCDGERPCREL